MNFIKKHFLFFLFLLGIILRFSIIFYDYSWDVNNHMVWAKDFLTRGPIGFYETQSSNVFANLTPNYPPLAIFIFVLMRLLNPVIHNIYWWLNLYIPIIPSNLIFFLEKTVFLAALMKIPAILTDLGIAYFVYLFAKKLIPNSRRLHIISACMILFNPVFIYNSALWGQIDSIPIFLFLVSIYFLIYKQRHIVSTIFLTLAFLIKPTVLIFLPVYIFIFVKKNGLKKSIIDLFIAIIIFVAFFIPFTTKNIFVFTIDTYLNKILAAQSLPYATNGAFNFWTLATQAKSVVDTPYRLIGYSIVGVINIFIIWCLSKSKKITEDFFMALFLSGLGAFLFLTKMHERYSLLPLVFILIYTLKNKKFTKWYVVLSVTSFINHYRNWAVPRLDFMMKPIESILFAYIISTMNVLIFFYLFWSFFRSIFSSPRALTTK